MKKERVAKKRGGGGCADIIFQLGDIRPKRRFTELQRRRLLRFYSPEKDNSFFFVFFFCLPLSFPSFAFCSCFSQSVCFFSTIFFATYYSSSDKQRVISLRLDFFFRVYTCIRFFLGRFFIFSLFPFFLRAADSEKKIPQGRRKY